MDRVRAGRQQRAARRRSWVITKHRLEHAPTEDLRSTTTAEERLAMMWELARDAWTMSGRPLPAYTRGAAPGRVVRAGAERDS